MQANNDKPAWTISAKEAELKLLPDEGKLIATFKDFELQGPITYNDPGTFEYVMSIEDLTGSTTKNRSPSTYALSEIPPAIKEQEDTLERVRQANVAQTAFGMLTGDFDSLSNAAWKPYYTFEAEARLSGGTRVRVSTGSAEDAPAPDPGVVQRFVPAGQSSRGRRFVSAGSSGRHPRCISVGRLRRARHWRVGGPGRCHGGRARAGWR